MKMQMYWFPIFDVHLLVVGLRERGCGIEVTTRELEMVLHHTKTLHPEMEGDGESSTTLVNGDRGYPSAHTGETARPTVQNLAKRRATSSACLNLAAGCLLIILPSCQIRVKNI